MNKINPIFEAINEIDDNTVASSIRENKSKLRKILKITAIAAAAMLMLGTAAAASTFGDDPIVKINDQQVTPWYSSYVDENGWTIETTAVKLPVDVGSYSPVGEIRAVFDEKSLNAAYYDELGVKLNDNTASGINFYLSATKDGETPCKSASGRFYENYHQSETITQDGNISIEFWQDALQALQSANDKKRDDNMTVDEKVEELMIYEEIVGFPEYGGFEHPSVRELVENGAIGSYSITDCAVNYKGTPNEVMKLYGYAPISIDGFSEKAETTVVMYTNAVFDKGNKCYTFIGDKLIVQQMFVYTLIEKQSGNEVLFTVWRSAENKDTYTNHFDFDYEYIQLNNETQARLHQSADNSYILEFEKDGAAYGLQLGHERDLAESILIKMELL